MRRQLDEAARQLEQVKGEFIAELERARERVTAAEERAASHEKRALREIDQERIARQKSEKQVDELRGQLTAAKAEVKDAALQHADALAALRTEVKLLQQDAERAAKQYVATTDDLINTRSLLQDAQRRAERVEAEVQVTRRLIDELKKTPTGRPAQKQKAG